MIRPTDDLRIRDVRPLIPPAILIEEIPISERASNVVSDARAAITAVIEGADPRLVIVVGPCSIHDPKAALEYAERLKPIADRLADSLVVVMRTYFEKPRTVVGWKGLINDPDLDESFHINKGLRLARQLLLDVNDLGLPTGSEFLDTQIPQHIADLTSWVAIGARTAESQVHRELASGLSMPVGFKNSTDGSTQIAVDAVLTARSPHWFPSVTKQGVSAIFQTLGNDACHVILRGGTRTGPNYDAEHVAKVGARLASKGLRESVMVDCSHGNSHKDHEKQALVADAICEQVAAGSRRIFGAMLESHLVGGRQDYVPGQPAVRGSSGSSPAITASAIAASAAVRAIGPVLSSSQSSGAMPAMLTRPRVGNTPTSALVAAGMRIELPVSVPLPSTAMFAAIAVTMPPDEPPGEKRTSYALPVRPNELLRFVSLLARSGMLASPTMIAPAALNFATIGASCGATSSCPARRNPSQPAVVTCPLTLAFALMTIGTPQSGPRAPAPFAASASSRAASASASRRNTVSIAP